MCEVNCTNCRVSAFKHGFCPDDFCEKHKALGTEDDFIRTLQRKVGKWILADTYDGRKRYRCSECLAFALKTDDGKENLSDYCSVCGARMKGEDDGTD